jgi:glycosyltransferase involved in cell wall biosynthesis
MKRGIPSISALLKLRSILKKQKPDLIQGWMYHGNLFASIGAFVFLQEVRVVWSVHHSLHDLASEKLMTRAVIKILACISSGVDSTLYVSNTSLAQHVSIGFKSQAEVVPNGIPLNQFRPSNSVKSVRKDLNIPENNALILTVGRYHPLKDYSSLIAGAKIVFADHVVNFVFVGHGLVSDNTELVDLIPKSLKCYFSLCGKQTDIAKYYHAADIFCLSSRSEAFPNVLGEAMACGLPCVTTDVGDAAYIVGDTGIVVPPRDPNSLAIAIMEMLGKSENEFADLKHRARGRIEEKFSLESVVERYASLYDKLLIGNNKST